MVPCVLDRVATVRSENADDLRDVERGAAAESDHAVGSVLAKCLPAGVRLGRGGIAEHAVEHGDLQPCLAQRRDKRLCDRQLRERAVGDDERARVSALLKVRADERGRTGAEMDRRRKRKAVDRHGVNGVSRTVRGQPTIRRSARQ